MNFTKRLPLLFLPLLTLVSAPSFADWTLNNDKSNLNFISVKKSSIVEVHHFTQLSGSVAETAGKANIEINLTSVDTMIPIRNERIQSLLFQTNMYPKANISADINVAEFKQLKAGESFKTKQTLVLDLHGVKNEMTADILVTKLVGNKINVSSLKPVVLKASDFKLVQGINDLRDIASLPSITTEVPVTFNLVFDAN
ncbi:YceI family protein [Psychrosphaera aquimarina]|uniref:YceI family protein n=1 Tax=Psychrosphaera aquimarina TaxID=2044854 RepID=A0ABU3QWL3_9GAMM|nr:YceI family protein [Psychrosphaera aquimarina]MDU0111810.1 YceI family protein [Psychrosphaera aquimarina]